MYRRGQVISYMPLSGRCSDYQRVSDFPQLVDDSSIISSPTDSHPFPLDTSVHVICYCFGFLSRTICTEDLAAKVRITPSPASRRTARVWFDSTKTHRGRRFSSVIGSILERRFFRAENDVNNGAPPHSRYPGRLRYGPSPSLPSEL